MHLLSKFCFRLIFAKSDRLEKNVCSPRTSIPSPSTLHGVWPRGKRAEFYGAAWDAVYWFNMWNLFWHGAKNARTGPGQCDTIIWVKYIIPWRLKLTWLWFNTNWTRLLLTHYWNDKEIMEHFKMKMLNLVDFQRTPQHPDYLTIMSLQMLWIQEHSTTWRSAWKKVIVLPKMETSLLCKNY